MLWSYYPEVALTTSVWALPRSLATTWGITVVFSSSGYLDVSVPRVCPHCWVICRSRLGCPIRISSDLGLLASTRSFSQLATSFFAFRCLGIRHVSFLLFFLFLPEINTDYIPQIYRNTSGICSTFSSFRYCVFFAICQITLSFSFPCIGAGNTCGLPILPADRVFILRIKPSGLILFVNLLLSGECRIRTDDPLLAKQVL